jgi:hypothetical protein
MNRRRVVALSTIVVCLLTAVAVAATTGRSEPKPTIPIQKLAHDLGINVSPVPVTVSDEYRREGEWVVCVNKATAVENAAGTDRAVYNVGLAEYNACNKRYGY